jgi:uracil-DNA glycosylase family 4
MDCYITATLRCAPPQNKPRPREILNCRPYLLQEIAMLKNVRVVVGLGRIGFDAVLSAYRELGRIEYTKKPKFSHGGTFSLGELTFIASFHPSQQNTFTGRLTEPMFDWIFSKARIILQDRDRR